jgi:hypothetical protein
MRSGPRIWNQLHVLPGVVASRPRHIPTAIVLSNRETHGNVPGASSIAGLPLLELGRDVCADVLNEITRAEGRVYKDSICGSEVEA